MPNGGLANGGMAETDGFFAGTWFAICNFIGGGVIAAAFGAAIALICLAIGIVLWAIVAGITWVIGLVT